MSSGMNARLDDLDHIANTKRKVALITGITGQVIYIVNQHI